VVILEEDETIARRLHEAGETVVHVSLADDDLDLTQLVDARALVANGPDDLNAVFALGAREQGFKGPLVATIENPSRRAPMMLAGASAAFTPSHVLAAAIAVRASAKISPLVVGLQPLQEHLEIAEIRVHDASPLAGSTLAKSALRKETGATIVGRWMDDELHSAPAPNDELEAGTILVAAGSPKSIRMLSDMAHPISTSGPLVVMGYNIVGQKIAEFLKDAGEDVRVIDSEGQIGVDFVGDVLDVVVLDRAGIKNARAVILALDSDSTTIFVTTVVRNFAPEVPILASADLVENVNRIQKAGADYVLSISQVMVQLMTRHVLGDAVSQQSRIKLVKVRPARLVGKNPLASKVREKTGCSVVAVMRKEEMLLSIPDSFKLLEEDFLYICGTSRAVDRYYDQFPASHM
jgi:Trk K+ transport system NAD-binding subunit